MVNRFYPRPALLAGVGDFLVNFAATRRAKEEAESGLQAQASAQQNQAIAGAVGDVAGAGIGAYAANQVGGDLNPLQRMQLASSFVPSLGSVSRAAGFLGSDISRGERQKEAQQRGIQGDAYIRGVDAYIDRYGEPPSPISSLVGPGAAPGGAQPPGVSPGATPLPAQNPASTAAYRKAQRLIQSFDTHMMRPMSPDERQAIETQLGPEVARARQLLQRDQPAPPPVTSEEMLAAGMNNGGATMFPDGRLLVPNGRNGTSVSMPPKKQPVDSGEAYRAARDEFVNARVESGTPRLEAQKEFTRQWADSLMIQDDRGTTIVDPNNGLPKFDELNSGRRKKTFEDYFSERMKGSTIPPPVDTIVAEWDALQEAEARYKLREEFQSLESFDDFMETLNESDPEFGLAMKRISEIKSLSTMGDVGPELELAAKRSAEYIRQTIGAVSYALGDLHPLIIRKLNELRDDIERILR